MGFISRTVGQDTKYPYKYYVDDQVFKGETEYDCMMQYHQWKLDNDPEYQQQTKKIEDTPLEISEIVTEKWRIGSYSLVGIGDERPTSWGNYWRIYLDGELYPVVNIWYENFKTIMEEQESKEVRFIIVNDLAFYINDDYDNDWFLDEPFITYNVDRGYPIAEKEKIRQYYEQHIK